MTTGDNVLDYQGAQAPSRAAGTDPLHCALCLLGASGALLLVGVGGDIVGLSSHPLFQRICPILVLFFLLSIPLGAVCFIWCTALALGLPPGAKRRRARKALLVLALHVASILAVFLSFIISIFKDCRNWH